MEKLLEVCGGCNAKLAPDLLSLVLSGLESHRRDDVLVGYESSDDAAIIKISDTEGIALTMDFFPAVVENPYYFGQIAATNALSDIYAMGGEPIAALNMVCFPENGYPAILKEILRGGADKVKEAGASLVGGHSIHDRKPKYGLAVIGKLKLSELWKNNSPMENDALILTKPLGAGLVTGGARAGVIPSKATDIAIKYMTQLNSKSAEVLKKYSVHALTDVTGFALSGHMLEMLDNKFDASIFVSALPLMPYAFEAAEGFAFTAGGQRNRKHAENKIRNLSSLSLAMQEIIFDPQTSGGLLCAISLDDSEKALKELKQNGIDAAIIGFIEKGDGFINLM